MRREAVIENVPEGEEEEELLEPLRQNAEAEGDDQEEPWPFDQMDQFDDNDANHEDNAGSEGDANPEDDAHSENEALAFPDESLGENDNDNDEDLVADVDLPQEYRRDFPQPAGTVLRTECSRLQIIYDQQLVEGMGNIHYPFANEMDWQLGAWMHDSGLAMTEMDQFLKLKYVSLLRCYHCYSRIV
jgi:hypothetical protein